VEDIIGVKHPLKFTSRIDMVIKKVQEMKKSGREEKDKTVNIG